MELYPGDCLEVMRELPAGAVQCCVTSPPYYGLRDYGSAGQIGLEATPDAHVARLVEVFREVRRVLRDDGTLWLNLGDSYAASGKGGGGSYEADGMTHSAGLRRKPPHGYKQKDLLGIPWRVAFALQADGWILRSDIIWHKPNPMPESVRDRPTKAHEYLFLLAKSQRYYYDADAIREPHSDPRVNDGVFTGGGGVNTPSFKARTKDGIARESFAMKDRTYNPLGRNRRTVWTVTPKPYTGAHFAVMPEALVEPCVLAGSAAGDTVLDPFVGSGTVGAVAVRHGRDFIGIDLNADYLALARERIGKATP